MPAKGGLRGPPGTPRTPPGLGSGHGGASSGQKPVPEEGLKRKPGATRGPIY